MPYVSIRCKFCIALSVAALWAGISIWLSLPWFYDLSIVVGSWFAGYLVAFIAIIPGFMNAFVLSSLYIDKRPKLKQVTDYPPVTILVAAFNEALSIEDTILSLAGQDYPGEMFIKVINDGSTDATSSIVKKFQTIINNLELVSYEKNQGKSSALNLGLKSAQTDIVITVDADCMIKRNGVQKLVLRYLSDPPNTKAVAGEILIRNSRENWITKAQEWDYFLGIASIKRIQSLFQGTLVAQGAFSLYDKNTVMALGGWPKTVGEDIVLTWKILGAGFRVGHAENACAFTQCPNTLTKFLRQRQRWSRGMIEAFKANPAILFRPRLSTFYIWWNLLFPFMDVAYTIGFLPGIVLALFGKFWIVGPMTLALLPVAAMMNKVMLTKSASMFKDEELKIRSNMSGFLFYMLAYCMILQPACVWGYICEILNLNKKWGTK